MNLPPRPAWMRDALCQEYPASWWFPDASAKKAKQVCRRCLVQEECLAYAMAGAERYGIWAGRDTKDIRRYRRARWDKPCPDCNTRIPIDDVAALVLAGVDTSRWCCRECRQARIEELGVAS